LVTIDKQAQGLQLLDGEQKPLLRILLEELQVTGKKIPNKAQRIISLSTGGRRRPEVREVRRRLRAQGVREKAGDEFLAGLRSVGIPPGSYSAKLSIFLQPAMPARQAARVILEHLHWTVRQNEQGIIADIDTEFLHDFRVAVRRTRSALGQIKGVFPAELLPPFKKDFASWGKLTNRMRDLDVFILKEKEYRNLLPLHLRPGLDALFEALRAERREEHAKLVQTLKGDSYRESKNRWSTFLVAVARNQLAPTANSEEPTVDLARRFIKKSYRRVMKLGQKINASSPQEDFHQLRIRCKQLRYLLEFFASVFPTEDVARFVKQLKKLQDNLGDYNDLHVQQSNLTKYLASIEPQSPDAILKAASIGGLISRLNQQQREVCDSFARTFQGFSQPGNVVLFKKLFGSP
jgi:CHAD domain-containing protein